jgi:hypothetical protein
MSLIIKTLEEILPLIRKWKAKMSLGEQDVLVVWIGATMLEHAMVNVLTK